MNKVEDWPVIFCVFDRWRCFGFLWIGDLAFPVFQIVSVKIVQNPVALDRNFFGILNREFTKIKVKLPVRRRILNFSKYVLVFSVINSWNMIKLSMKVSFTSTFLIVFTGWTLAVPSLKSVISRRFERTRISSASNSQSAWSLLEMKCCDIS